MANVVTTIAVIAGDRSFERIARARTDEVVAGLVRGDDEHETDDGAELESRADGDARGREPREQRAPNGVRRVDDRIDHAGRACARRTR